MCGFQHRSKCGVQDGDSQALCSGHCARHEAKSSVAAVTIASDSAWNVREVSVPVLEAVEALAVILPPSPTWLDVSGVLQNAHQGSGTQC